MKIEVIQDAINNVFKGLKEQEKNYTLAELKQKLINELYKIPITNYEIKDVEILKILFN